MVKVTKSVKFITLCAALIWLLPKASFVGSVWQTQFSPIQNVRVEFGNGDRMTGALTLMWNGNYRVQDQDERQRDFDPAVTWLVFPSVDDAPKGIQWRSIAPAALLVGLWGIGVFMLFSGLFPAGRTRSET